METTQQIQNRAAFGQQLTFAGMTTSIAGGIASLMGSIGGAIVQREQAKAQADNLRHRAAMNRLNARQAAADAQAVMRAGRARIGQLTALAGQVKSAQITRTGARGVVIGEGSAAEVTATTDIVKAIEMLSTNRDTVARAGAVRMQGVNYQNASLLDGVSAGNLRRTANTISPVLAGFASELRNFGSFARSYGPYVSRR